VKRYSPKIVHGAMAPLVSHGIAPLIFDPKCFFFVLSDICFGVTGASRQASVELAWTAVWGQ